MITRMYAPTRYLLSNTTIRRKRLLSLPGKILVRVGQELCPDDVIAESEHGADFLTLDLARGLGISAEKVAAHIQVAPGSLLHQGDVIAGPVGMTRRVIRAPQDGVVAVILEELMVLDLQTRKTTLKAGMPGEVVEILDPYGVVIQTRGALAQGVWGNGKMATGEMVVVIRSPNQAATMAMLPEAVQGKIVVTGHCEEEAILQRAAALPLAGLVLASLNPELADTAARLSIPVMVQEGFGKHALHPASFQLFSEMAQQEVSLNAQAWDPYLGACPEVVQSRKEISEAPEPSACHAFTTGQLVRVATTPYMGRMGTLLSWRSSMEFFGGRRAEAGEIKLESGETIWLPLANCEVFEARVE